MIEFNNVTRRSRQLYCTLYAGARNARSIVVSLREGDLLEFRELGRRGRWHLPVDAAFRYAIRLAALAQARERKGRRCK